MSKEIISRSLENEFWRTRAEAKALYKQWQITPDDGRLMEAYSKAWEAHQKASVLLFLNECEND